MNVRYKFLLAPLLVCCFFFYGHSQTIKTKKTRKIEETEATSLDQNYVTYMGHTMPLNFGFIQEEFFDEIYFTSKYPKLDKDGDLADSDENMDVMYFEWNHWEKKGSTLSLRKTDELKELPEGTYTYSLDKNNTHAFTFDDVVLNINIPNDPIKLVDGDVKIKEGTIIVKKIRQDTYSITWDIVVNDYPLKGNFTGYLTKVDW